MIYLLIFFLDEGRTSLYGSPVKPSIQGITYRPILLAALSSRSGSSQLLSHPIHVVILSGPGTSRREVPAQSKGPYNPFRGQGRVGNSPAGLLARLLWR